MTAMSTHQVKSPKRVLRPAGGIIGSTSLAVSWAFAARVEGHSRRRTGNPRGIIGPADLNSQRQSMARSKTCRNGNSLWFRLPGVTQAYRSGSPLGQPADQAFWQSPPVSRIRRAFLALRSDPLESETQATTRQWLLLCHHDSTFDLFLPRPCGAQTDVESAGRPALDVAPSESAKPQSRFPEFNVESRARRS